MESQKLTIVPVTLHVQKENIQYEFSLTVKQLEGLGLLKEI
ncbi:hypothetical protein [Bacillus sp. OV322]|nr:hypothetical protein [Bacillus sp. OV322]